MIMTTPDGIEADVHESSVQRKLDAGWKFMEAAEVKAAPKPDSNSEDKGE